MDKLVLLGIAFTEGLALLALMMVIAVQHNRKREVEERNRALMKRLQQRNKEAAKTVARYELNCFFLRERAEEQEKALKRKDALLHQKWKNAKGQGDQA